MKRTVGILFNAKQPFLPPTFYPGLRGTRAQVLFHMRASYSSFIALTHLGSWRARATMQGLVIVGIMVVRPYFKLHLMMTFFEQVYMGLWFSGGVGEVGLVGELVGMGKGLGE